MNDQERQALNDALTEWRFHSAAPWWAWYDEGDLVGGANNPLTERGLEIHEAAIVRHDQWVKGRLR